jgi:hypothetical protein
LGVVLPPQALRFTDIIVHAGLEASPGMGVDVAQPAGFANYAHWKTLTPLLDCFDSDECTQLCGSACKFDPVWGLIGVQK